MKMQYTTSAPSKTRAQGFTLVELMLAMAFLGFLLLFIVVAMIQLIGTYNKGLAYKEINQAGRTITEELTRNIRTSGSAAVNSQYVARGRLCVAGQAYIWNSPTTAPLNQYQNTNEAIDGVIRVPDTAGQYCSGDATPPAVDRSQETVLARGNVQIRELTAKSADNGRLITLNILFSTSGDNAPPNGSNECLPGRLGEYCAVAAFDITVANRN